MAHAEKLVKSWRVHYQLPNGKWTTMSGFRTKSAALKKGRDLEAAGAAGTFVDPRKSATPLGVWVPIWMAAQTVDPNTVAKRRGLLKKHLLPEWEFTALQDVNNLFTVKSWAGRQTCDRTTVTQALTLLSMILTGAADAGYLPGNALARRRRTTGSSNRQQSKPESVWAHPEHVRELYERMGGVAGLMVLVAGYTGMRWGEIAGLQKKNCLLLRRDRLPGGKHLVRKVIRIDPDTGSLHEVAFELTEEQRKLWEMQETARLAKAGAPGAKTRRPAKRRPTPDSEVRLYLGPPKNETSAREVDVPEFLAELLALHMAVWPYEQLFSCPSNGAHWRRGNFIRSELRPAADGRVALKASRGHAPRAAWSPILPGLTMRGLRHSHSTWMKEDRIDRALRFERMGWVVDDIEGVYEHVTPQMRQELLTAMQARWERTVGAVGATG